MADRGYDPAMGARPIKREVENSIVRKLVKPILKSELESGDTVKVTVKKDDIHLDFVKPKSKVEEAKEVVSESESK